VIGRLALAALVAAAAAGRAGVASGDEASGEVTPEAAAAAPEAGGDGATGEDSPSAGEGDQTGEDSPRAGEGDQTGGDAAAADEGDRAGEGSSGAGEAGRPSGGAASGTTGSTAADLGDGPGLAAGALPGEDPGDDAPAGVQELGARLGMVAGGRTTPGGLLLSAVYLYQMSETDWFEGGIGFSFGGGDAACFRDRDDQFVCDHGATSGLSGGISLGVRRFLGGRQRFVPFAGAGFDVRYVGFGADEVRGLALPAWLEAGARARVADGIAIAAEARYQFGVGWLDHDLGIEPQAGLVVGVGVDFRLEEP
jgi:hypothetical protein